MSEMFDFDDETADGELMHYGILRKSGRYPWGSGENPHQRNRSFLDHVQALEKQGLTEAEIAKGLGIPSVERPSTTVLRALKAIAKNEQKKTAEQQAERLKRTGMSNSAIGREMGVNESSVRALLDPSQQARSGRLMMTADTLKKAIEDKRYIDVGVGVENNMGITNNQLAQAVAMLREEGYKYYYVNVEQLGTGKQTKRKILAKPEVEWAEVRDNQDKIGLVGVYSEDNGSSFNPISPPRPVDSSRVAIVYNSEGGGEKDGVIEVRRGVDDISLGNARYAQVRIAVDGTHYLKGMAMYADDLPDGVDLRFNTNKDPKPGATKLDAMKSVKSDDEANPFGAITRQMTYIDKDGKQQQSVMNIVNEEADWEKWSKNLSSQMLSKQTPNLAKKQLGLKHELKREELDDIKALNNPAVKRALLQSFADGADSSADKLKAAGLPRTMNHVILPINSLKDTEIYAPRYRNGERVVLIRHPHGGTFEIPELIVNNNNKDAKRLINNATDAVGINSRVAERLSGADFDGDTVLVIPNNQKGPLGVKTSPALAGLKNFNPQEAYAGYEGMPKMSAHNKQTQMGNVSNLITDMTILGAPDSEIARAVRHSMVVIDAEKHGLDYKRSAKENGIAELKEKYQGGKRRGATTLISKASSEIRVPERKPRPAADGGPIDPKTGKLVFVETGDGYEDAKGNWVARSSKVTNMAYTDDAHTLVSEAGSVMENVYADHANKMKALANEARKEWMATKPRKYSPSAREVYAPQYNSLRQKLNRALKNKPLERKAQALGNAILRAKMDSNPGMDKADLKKERGRALVEARLRVGAAKSPIVIEDDEWEAIQSGAISNNFLENILANTDIDRVRQLATPRDRPAMPPSKIARAQAMLALGYPQSEIADALGVSVSTLSAALK